mgnify:FL=1|tara:strand:- start:1429 stop:1623 length:195 start_codon:yes stop_codon:yes gene_type:complete
MIGYLSFKMIEVPLKTQLLIGIITFLVFFFIIKLVIKNISSTNDEGETLINLNKLGRRHRSNEK